MSVFHDPDGVFSSDMLMTFDNAVSRAWPTEEQILETIAAAVTAAMPSKEMICKAIEQGIARR